MLACCAQRQKLATWALCGFGRQADEQQWGEIGGIVIWKKHFSWTSSSVINTLPRSKNVLLDLQAQVRGKREVGPGQTMEDNHSHINEESGYCPTIPENTLQIEELAADTHQKFMLVSSSASFIAGKVPGNLVFFTLIFQATLSGWLVSSVTTRRTSSTRTFKNIRMALQEMVS